MGMDDIQIVGGGTSAASPELVRSVLDDPERKIQVSEALDSLLTVIREGGGEPAKVVTANRSGRGSPFGVLVPEFIPQYYQDTDSGKHWKSIGVSNKDWQQL